MINTPQNPQHKHIVSGSALIADFLGWENYGDGKTYKFPNLYPVYNIDDEGERIDRRVGRAFVFDFFHDNKSGRYKHKCTPRMQFNRELITEDSPDEANSLINLFAYMYISYMELGTIDPPASNLQNFRMAHKIGDIMISWLDEYFMMETNYGYIEKGEMYSLFLTQNQGLSGANRNKYSTAKKFKDVVGYYCTLRGLVFNPEELHTDKQNKRIIMPSKTRTNAGGGISCEHFYIMPEALYAESKVSAKQEVEDLVKLNIQLKADFDTIGPPLQGEGPF